MFVSLMTSPYTLSAPINDNKCKMRTSREVHRKWLDLYNIGESHESTYIAPPFVGIIHHLRSNTGAGDSLLFGDHGCPTKLASDDAPLQQRSICPWYNALSEDQRRYPKVLTEARCKCDRCLGVDGLSQCEPVYYNVHVLLRTEQCDREGYYKWQSGWQKISVGCTCARTPTV